MMTNLSRLGSLVVPLLLLIATSNANPRTAPDGDRFEGAIWTFQMKPRQQGLVTLRGNFRVSNHVVYQKKTREASDFRKKVGRNHPSGKRTRIEFHDLRAFTLRKQVKNGIKGTARIKIDEFGRWSGMFTDGRGRNWDFQCKRAQE